MSNPLFDALGGAKAQQGTKRNLAPGLLRYINNFQGNPIQSVQNKVSSGEWTQQQYDELHSAAENIARQMMSFIMRK